jgi:hypothetical protein
MTKAVLFARSWFKGEWRFYKMNRKTAFIKEFKDVFSVSLKVKFQPFETDF